jgi:hypothetical protein
MWSIETKVFGRPNTLVPTDHICTRYTSKYGRFHHKTAKCAQNRAKADQSMLLLSFGTLNLRFRGAALLNQLLATP